MLCDELYHVSETEVVVNEQKVSPPSFLAYVTVVFHHKIPLRSRTQVWQNKRTE